MSNSTGRALVDRFKGKAKRIAGSLLGDPALEGEGALHEKTADTREVAAGLEAAAAEAQLERERREARQKAAIAHDEGHAHQERMAAEREAVAAEEEARRARATAEVLDRAAEPGEQRG